MTYALECGGMEKSILKLALVAIELGHEVSLLTTEHPGIWFEKFKAAGISVSHARKHPLGGVFHVFRIARTLRRLRADIVILFHARLAQAGLRMLNRSTVVVPTVRLHDESIYRIALANSECWNVILCNSPALVKEVERRCSQAKSVCIPNRVDLPDEGKVGQRVGFGIQTDVLFVGRLVEHKGVRLLPRILSECLSLNLNVRLKIVGDGELLEWLRAEIVIRKLGDHVQLFGRRSSSEVLQHYCDSHILLLPTYAEGMPNVVLEALAHGCVPVVTRLNGVTDSIVKDGKSGFLVATGSVSGFVRAIRMLSADGALWRQLSATGIQDVRENHSSTRLKDDYATFFAQIQQNRFGKLHRSTPALPVCLQLLRMGDFIPDVIKYLGRPIRRRLPAKLGGLHLGGA